MNHKFFRPIAIIVLFFFCWTFAGGYQAVYAATRTQNTEHRIQTKEKGLEEKFQKTIDEIVQTVQAVQTVQTVEERKAKKEKLKEKKAEIEALDVEIRKQFAETEKKLKDAKLPDKILKRHYDFVKKYEENLKELKANLEAIEKAKGKVEAEVEKARKHLQKIKPPKKHVPLDPNKLPHRTPESTKKKPRLKKEEFHKDSGQLSVVNSQGKTNNELLTMNYEPVLVASAGSLDGLLESPSPNTYDLQPVLLAQATNQPVNQSTNQPTSADLSETIEVQFTSEIIAKAEELENNPVKIYNWVRNNIEFVPTYGSIQGADYCLQTKQCNAFDTASLLITLLRASGIHARYVYGTIEIPIGKVMNWVGGFTDANAALTLIASGGIPGTILTSGGKIVAAQMEHVWVEAYVDYIPYRGAVKGPGDTWIPLDASFKQYNYVEGIDADTAVPTDFDALLAEVESQSTINSEIPSITGLPAETIQNQVSDFQTRLNDYLAANYPQVDDYYELSKTLHGYREIIKKELRFLPNTLAGMKVLAKLDAFSEIPDSLRHKISFSLKNSDLVLDDISFTYSVPLPEIAGKRITLSYIPATPEDAQVMSDAEGILNFPLYLVEVIPDLKIGGQTVASGNVIGMGKEQSFGITFYKPTGTSDRVINTIQAGEYYAVGLDINKVTFQYLYDRANKWQPDTAEDRDDRLGELLYLTAMFYFARSNHFMDELARSSNIISLRHPSEAMVGMKFNASYLFDIPMTITSVGLNMDVDRDVISPVSKTNNSNTRLWFMIQKGLYGSGLEHHLFEYLMGFEAISAVKFLDLASQQNIPIYIIDSENAQRVEELEISSEDKRDITSFINAGKIVLVPQSKIQYVDYSGIGYAAIDTNTGAGAYMISWGYAGGDTVQENVEALLKLADELLGEIGEWVSFPYKITIDNLLADYPDIADKPDKKFKEWTETVLYVGQVAKYIPYTQIRVIIGQQILYNTMIMLLELTIP